eukprot:608814-Pyramimonas_sp.AAC.1
MGMETHLMDGRLLEAQKKLSTLRWKCAASPAIPTALEGQVGHAGVWVICGSCIGSRVMHPCKQYISDAPQSYGTQWVAIAIRQHNVDIILIEVYLNYGEGAFGTAGYALA